MTGGVDLGHRRLFCGLEASREYSTPLEWNGEPHGVGEKGIMKTFKTERIAVLGAGSWGATLASLLANKGHEVSLWEFDPRAAEALSSTPTLPLLPELT